MGTALSPEKWHLAPDLPMKSSSNLLELGRPPSCSRLRPAEEGSWLQEMLRDSPCRKKHMEERVSWTPEQILAYRQVEENTWRVGILDIRPNSGLQTSNAPE